MVNNEVPRPLIPPFMLEKMNQRDRTAYERWYYGPRPKRKSTPKRKSAPADNSLRARLFRASNGYCGLCGKRIKTVHNVTVDHTVPRAKGGKNANNRTPAHRKCNGAKADRMPTGCELIWLDVVNTRLTRA